MSVLRCRDGDDERLLDDDSDSDARLKRDESARYAMLRDEVTSHGAF